MPTAPLVNAFQWLEPWLRPDGASAGWVLGGSGLAAILAVTVLAWKRESRRSAELEALLEAKTAERREREAGPGASACQPWQEEAGPARLKDGKLEALGILAGGLAHDFNNLLGAMEGNVELAKLAVDQSGPVGSYLQALDGLIARSSNLVQQILVYSGRGKLALGPLDLNQVAEETTRLLRASLGRKVALELATAPGLPLMEGNAGLIQQMLTGLAFNAAEAAAGPDAVVTIRTGLELVSPGAIRDAFQGQEIQPGPHVVLEVADNGPGAAAVAQERILDPFATAQVAGTGLGFSSLAGNLQALRGALQLHFEPGKGTSFKLLFPVIPAAGAREPAERQGFEEAFGSYRGVGTVLVVDDEDPLRTMTAEALRRIGLKTLEARDGMEALREFEANREQIRLVILDLTMPRMDGEDTFRALRRNGMMAPVILTSGFSEHEVRQHFRGKGISGFLQKPYRLQALAQVVRTVLLGEESLGFRAREGRDPLVADADVLLGSPMLNQQHRHLLDAFNELVATLSPGRQRYDQVRAVASLKAVALTHFGVEENLMRTLAYPRTLEHQRCHVRLITQINDVTDRIHRGTLTITPGLLDYLEGWLFHHMQEEDRRLAQFLSTAGH